MKLAIFILLLASCSHVEPIKKKEPRHDCIDTAKSFTCVRVSNVYDGDTFTIKISNVPAFFALQDVRINGIDAPEIRTKKLCEKELGHRARLLLANILGGAKRIDLENLERDKYGRILADVMADGQNVAMDLIIAGLAREYDGGKREPWECE